MSQAKFIFVPLLLLLTTPLTQANAGSGTTTPILWAWRTGPPSAIQDQVDAGYRIVSLQLISTTPYTLTALFVRNKGTYAKTWYWFYNIDGTKLSKTLHTLNARVVDLEPYTISDKRYFAVVLHTNTGDGEKAWWYYYDASPRFIAAKLDENNGRLVDLDVYKVAGSTRYSAVMIRNTDDDEREWWWYYNVSRVFIRRKLAKNRARLTVIERSSAGRYDVIMERTSATWWYYYAQSSALVEKAAQNGARLVHVEPYFHNGVRRYIGIMLSNVNDLTRRIYNVLAPERTGGAFGLYTKQIRGPVLAALQHNYVYEPASSIKALHLAHAMRRVQSGIDDLNNIVSYFNDVSGSCPLNSGIVKERLETVLQRMMRASSNTATQGIRARYGKSAINLSARQLGMTKTRIRHRIGCAVSSTRIRGQIDHPNSLTLVDITRLYERVATSFLFGTHRAKFLNIMSSLTRLSPIVTQEAKKLPFLTTERMDQFRSLTYSRQKGGSYKINGKYYRSIGAYIRLPFHSCRGDISFKEYVLGVFIHQSTTSVKSGLISGAGAETMRDEIRKALSSFQPCLSVVKRA